jgi:hypothetical protein
LSHFVTQIQGAPTFLQNLHFAGCSRRQQDTSKPAKGKRGNKKGKRGREPTIGIVFFHRTTIDGESSQKLNKIGKTFRQDVAFT